MLDYRPEGMRMWDAWGIEHDGNAHLLHLQMLAPGSARAQQEADTLGHAVSADLVTWEEQPLALAPGPAGGLDDMQPWTGCVVRHQDRFHLYYTMRSTRDGARGQHIGLATSDDLTHWQRHPGNPVISPDPRWYVSHDRPLPNGIVDCRDLVLVEDPDGNGWLGFYAARVPSQEQAEGAVIAAVRSPDLLHWEHLPPAFAPGKYACIEVPDVFFLNGRWYLTCLAGNNYGNRGIYSESNLVQGTIYAVADRPEGPYREFPDNNVLLGGDGTCGYSCRSLVFEGERHVLYTQRGPDTLSPPMRLRATPEGWLRLAYSPRAQVWRQETLLQAGDAPPIARLPACHGWWRLPGGTWRVEEGRYIGASRAGWQIADLGIGAAAVEMEASITLHKGVAAGLVWRQDTAQADCGGNLVFFLDAEAQQARAAHAPDFGEPHARRCSLTPGRALHLRVCLRPQRAEVYVDDILSLQFTPKLPEATAPAVGLFVDRGEVEISGLTVHSLRDG